MMMWIPIVLAIGALAVVWIYNTLVRLRVECDNAWSDIDVQLKRRHDMIPNLVETVKGYAGHERQTLEAVIRARAAAAGAPEAEPKARGQAEGFLTQALRQLFAVAEAYPDLKASANFQQLQESLQKVEDAVASARRYYNAVVRDMNTKVSQFPSNLVARAFAFRDREFFEITADAERKAPAVRF